VRLALLLLLLGWLPARAQEGPRIHLKARVHDDLRSVTGEVELFDPAGTSLHDLLSALPLPADDLQLRRTFPGAVQAGRLRLLPREPTRESERALFVSVLPERVDASGYVSGRGLFANGLWHPQPMHHQELALVDWEVELWVPEGSVGVLNGVVLEARAEDRLLRWKGRAERLALAVLPGGRVQRHAVAGGVLRIVDAGPRRPRRDAELVALLEASWPGPTPPDLTVVESPSWRRLVRTGPGTLFLSDMAFRLSRGLWSYHHSAVRRGLLRAGLPLVDPDLRELVADTLAERVAEGPDARKTLGWLSWIPQIDDLLYDGSLPFYSEVFDEQWPGDPVLDDLAELSARKAPGRVLQHRIDHRLGEGTALGLARRLLQGTDPEQALAEIGLTGEGFEELRRLAGPTDLRVDLRREGEAFVARVERRAEPDAPAEAIILRIDEQEQAWLAGPGPALLRQPLEERPRSIEIDPHGDVDQSPLFDRWPRRWTVVASAFPAELNLSDGRITAYADLTFRRQYDTRWLFDLGLATDARDLVRAQAGVFHFRGPLQDRRSRPLRLWALAGPALLDPRYRPTEDGRIALGGGLGFAWETRVDTDMPMRGYRLSSSVDGGLIPGSTARWGGLRSGLTGLLPLGGRLALAGRASGGLAVGEVEHRLISLGGSGGVRGLPAADLLGHQAAVVGVEGRWNALRYTNIPLPLAWLSQLQLSAGLDAGLLRVAPGSPSEGGWRATGWALGLGGKADLLGARPTYAAITVAGLLESQPRIEPTSAWPQIALRLDRNF
jgi:hypothetical protein